ncbi:hypothetical protein PRIPAC_89065, partial [Pristionchus pacificus]
ELVSNLVVFLSVSIAVVISLLLFLRLPKISERFYRTTLSRRERYEQHILRYQAKENVNSAKLLKRFVILNVALSPLAIMGYYYLKSQRALHASVL